MHNLQTERFYKAHMVNGMMTSSDELDQDIPTSRRVAELGLSEQEKKGLLAFLRAL